MIWQNPFLIRCTEKTNEDDFIHLFGAEILNVIDADSVNTTTFVRSTPGAGKTTLFNALQPNILVKVKRSVNEDYFNKVKEYGFIGKDDRVDLLSCYLSFALNYDIIDTVFKNGRRQQVFFALVNTRVTVLMLKGIITMLELKGVSELCDISFKNLPDVLVGLGIKNGKDLFEWTQKEERKICNYIDELSDEKTNFTFVYNDLSLFEIFIPSNMFFRGNPFASKTLVVLDEADRLTVSQREFLTNTLCAARLKVGVWIGERIEAMSDEEIITPAIVDRDYREIRLEDKYGDMKKHYKSMLSDIANKRVSLAKSNNINSFDSCLNDSMEYREYNNALKGFIDKSTELINLQESPILDYRRVISKISADDIEIYQQALMLSSLLIEFNRNKENRQLALETDEYTWEQFEVSHKKHRSVAEYYLCIELKIPFYYKKETLLTLSSSNVEQFLAFAGEIFSNSDSKYAKGERVISLKPNEQEIAIKKVAKQRFMEIAKRFVHGKYIQNLFNNLSELFTETRKKWRHSYAGGTFTGFAIQEELLETLIRDERYNLLKRVISSSIAANYLKMKTTDHDGKRWVVFYFNKWLCVHYNLPLTYGGWYKIATLGDLSYKLDAIEEIEKQQLTL